MGTASPSGHRISSRTPHHLPGTTSPPGHRIISRAEHHLPGTASPPGHSIASRARHRLPHTDEPAADRRHHKMDSLLASLLVFKGQIAAKGLTLLQAEVNTAAPGSVLGVCQDPGSCFPCAPTLAPVAPAVQHMGSLHLRLSEPGWFLASAHSASSELPSGLSPAKKTAPDSPGVCSAALHTRAQVESSADKLTAPGCPLLLLPWPQPLSECP